MPVHDIIESIPDRTWDKMVRMHPKWLKVGCALPIEKDQTEMWRKLNVMVKEGKLPPLDEEHDWTIYHSMSHKYFHSEAIMTWDHQHFVTIEIFVTPRAGNRLIIDLISRSVPDNKGLDPVGVVPKQTFRKLTEIAYKRCEDMGRYYGLGNNCFHFTEGFLYQDLKLEQPSIKQTAQRYGMWFSRLTGLNGCCS